MTLHEHFTSIYPLIVIGLAIAIVIRVICKLGKIEPESLVGVKPAFRGFNTREEYLKARVEMDLEEFLEKANATSKSITRRSADVSWSAGTLSSMEELFRQEKAAAKIQKASARPSDFDLLKGMPWPAGGGGAGGSGGDVVSGGSGGYAFCGPSGHPGTAGVPGIQEVNGLPIKEGCWYRRIATGSLAILRNFKGSCGVFSFQDGVSRVCQDSEVELAIPKLGESWTANKCPKHRYSATVNYQIRNGNFSEAYAKENVLCGCLVPFEFGNGNV